MKRDLWRAALLTAFLAALFCLVYGRTSLAAWSVPVQYGGDTVSFLAYLKAARDGHVVPVAATFVPDLGAPYEASWNDYPRPQKLFFWLAGAAARRIGVFPTANALLLLGHLLAGLAFFGVARYLRIRPAWAASGALAFAAAHYIWFRSLAHLALSLCWHIPLDLLVLGWCFRRHGLPLRSRRFAFATAVAVVAALFNVYYAAMLVQLLALCALAHLVRGSGRKAVAPILLAVLVVGLFALESLGTLLYPVEHGRNLLAVQRSYGDLEHYALKPIELFLAPPGRGLFRFGSLATGYWDNARGEVGSAYLGLCAVLGLVMLVARPVRGLLRGRPSTFPPALAGVLWVLAFSIAGGINGVLGSFGVVLLRGTNRYSVWIVAVALLHVVGRLSRGTVGTRWPRLAAVLFAVLALLDQLPGIATRSEVAAQEQAVATDRAFADNLEGALRGRAMVFMLPVLAFPEGGGIRQMPDYEHFRPYLFTSRLRYSYGTDKGRSREDWQWRVQAMSPSLMIDRLEGYGFSAIVVDRLAYPDGGTSLLESLAAAGRPVTIEEEGRGRAFVRLVPRAPARLPASAPRPGEGWYGRPQDEGLWARDARAEWLFDNASSAPTAVTLAFELMAATPRTVSLHQGDRQIGSWRLEDTVRVSGLRVLLPPGESRLELRSDRPSELTEIGNRLRMAAFAVRDLEMTED